MAMKNYSLHENVAFYSKLYAAMVAAQNAIQHDYAVGEINNLASIHDAVSERLTQIDPEGDVAHEEPKTPKSRESVELTIEDGWLVGESRNTKATLSQYNLPTALFQLVELLGDGVKVRLTLEEV